MGFENRLKYFRSQMNELGWDGAFLAPSGDMEYLIGVRRQRPMQLKDTCMVTGYMVQY